MKADDCWTMQAVIVDTPWQNPAAGRRFDTLLEAVLDARLDSDDLSPWIFLEDGRLLSPAQIANHRQLLLSGRASTEQSARRARNQAIQFWWQGWRRAMADVAPLPHSGATAIKH